MDAIFKRKSARQYTNKQISEENLNLILKAGMQAPVASGAYDSLHITVCQNEELLNDIGNEVSNLMEKIIGKKMNKNFGAPTMIFISSKRTNVPGIEYANSACVLENMCICATSLGIDNIIWAAAIMIAKQDKYRNRLNIPEGYEPVLCASFGYAKNYEEPKIHSININRV